MRPFSFLHIWRILNNCPNQMFSLNLRMQCNMYLNYCKTSKQLHCTIIGFYNHVEIYTRHDLQFLHFFYVYVSHIMCSESGLRAFCFTRFTDHMNKKSARLECHVFLNPMGLAKYVNLHQQVSGITWEEKTTN